MGRHIMYRNEPDDAFVKAVDLHVELINHALRGIPPERVRLHTCYGLNHGPRLHDVAFSDVVGFMLQINAGAYSFEASNPRHEHEYHVWETVRLPEGKAIIPGVISHTTNLVEHPELIAERIVRFARAVEPDNVALRDLEIHAKKRRDQDLPTLPSTVGQEKATNPFVRVGEPAVIAAASKFAGRQLTDPVGVLAAVREWKNGF